MIDILQAKQEAEDARKRYLQELTPCGAYNSILYMRSVIAQARYDNLLESAEA